MAIMLLHSAMLLSSEIKIAVAANVSYAINPLVKAFHVAHPEIKVQAILGSSGKLFSQIEHGAPYDLFMSANMKYPSRLYEDNFTTSKPVVYTQGALALFSCKAREFDAGLKILSDDSIKRIAVANPKTAPYGVATKEALQSAKVYNTLKEKFVYGESISQTVIYAKNAADIGIIAKASLFSPQMLAYKKGIHWIDIDESFYKPIEQGMVILKKSEVKSGVKDFYDFVQSSRAKKILKSFGYKVH